MKRVLSIALLSCFALTISCASKEEAKTPQNTEAKKQAETKPAMLVKKDKTDGSELAYTCLVAGDKRVVTMDKQPKRCEVHYTKSGEKTQVAWAEAHPEICTNTFDKIRSNIEGNGFKCKNGLETTEKPRETASSK